MYKRLTLFPVKEKRTEKSPDYSISASRQDENGNWINATVGSAWLEIMKDGRQVIQITMSKGYTNAQGEIFPAYEVTEAQQAQPLQPTQPVQSTVPANTPVNVNPAPVGTIPPADPEQSNIPAY